MNSTTRRRVNAERKCEYHFTNLLNLRTDSQIEQASVWYADETAYCQGLANLYNLSLALVTTWYAWTSIRQRLAQNKVLTVEACRYEGRVEALPVVVAGCRAAYEAWFRHDDPTDTLTGRKTRNFALALQGDTEAIVVDVWMMRAAGWPDRDAPTKVQYDAIERVIRRMAGKMGLEPRTLQALIWIIKRGGAV